MPSRRELLAVARLELAEVLRSRWVFFALGVYAVLGGTFVFLATRESGVMGFTGTGRVLFSFCHALILLLPLLGLSATGQVVNRAREEGALELLFSHPVSRGSYFVAISLVRFAVLIMPLAILLPATAIYGWVAFGEPVPWSFLVRSLAVSASLLAASVGAGLMISTWVRDQAKALMILLLVWAASVVLVDFGLVGLMLQWRLDPRVVFALATINPVQSARMALLSAADPELGTLGPVGFYLANHIGAGALLALGIGWPLLLATAAWTLTLRRFGRGDLI